MTEEERVAAIAAQINQARQAWKAGGQQGPMPGLDFERSYMGTAEAQRPNVTWGGSTPTAPQTGPFTMPGTPNVPMPQPAAGPNSNSPSNLAVGPAQPAQAQAPQQQDRVATPVQQPAGPMQGLQAAGEQDAPTVKKKAESKPVNILSQMRY